MAHRDAVAEAIIHVREYQGDDPIALEYWARMLAAEVVALRSEGTTVARHCDLMDQSWKLMQHVWNTRHDNEWRVAVKKWRDAYYALWSEHCGRDPGPAPYGLPVLSPRVPPT